MVNRNAEPGETAAGGTGAGVQWSYNKKKILCTA